MPSQRVPVIKETHVVVPPNWTESSRVEPFERLRPSYLHFSDPANETTILWNSRRHRKGRTVVTRDKEGKRITKERFFFNPLGEYTYWNWDVKNISWWVAQFFLWGSVAWVLNGFAVWVDPFSTTARANRMAQITGLIGGTFFEIGAFLAYLEALNIHPHADGDAAYNPLTPGATRAATASPIGDRGATIEDAVPPHGEPNGIEMHEIGTDDDQLLPAGSPRSHVAHTVHDSVDVGSDSAPRKRSRATSHGGEGDTHEHEKREPKDKQKQAAEEVPTPDVGESSATRRHNIGSPDGDGDGKPGSSDPSAAPQTRKRAGTADSVTDSYDPPSVFTAPSHVTIDRSSTVDSGSDTDEAEELEVDPPVPIETIPRVVVKREFKLRGSRFHEIGYIASLVQFVAATIFWISTIVNMPHVINQRNVGEVQGLFWTPQVVGGTGFIIASILFMYEVQPKWYHIKPKNVGWEVGFWNFVGAIGFTLCGIFGYYRFANRYQHWGASFSTFWGGWSFLIGSYFQLLEAINK